jgi:formylglycine-generating enzyme required for sulfatase activity
LHIEGGVHCADFIGRDQVNHYGFSAEDVTALIERVLAFLDAGANFLRERTAEGWGERLVAELQGEKIVFHPGAVQQLGQRRDLRAYLLALTVHRDYQVWATKFIPLAGKMDVRKIIAGLDIPVAFSEFRLPPPGSGPQAQASTVPLEDITDALKQHAAFVILGEPGCGKTTTLQKIAFEAARGSLSGQPGRIPLFVRLSQQGERDPFDFLAAEWDRRTGKDFGGSLAAGRVLVLADGINEIPLQERDARLKSWRYFADDYSRSNKFVFTGRERDYEQQLNLPRVLVEPLDDERISDYLQRNEAEGLQELLDDPRTRLRQMAGNPFNLALLTFAYQSNQREMSNRGALLKWFAGELFAREERLAHPGWLPRNVQVRALAELAFAMQSLGESNTLLYEQARDLLPQTIPFLGEDIAIQPARLFEFGRAATILDPNTLPDVRFYHHLLQEYFAALDLLRRFKTGEDLAHLWQCKRLASNMTPAEVGEWDPLPEPPPTGWEVTTILACGLASLDEIDPQHLIEAIRPHNPVLAGRCLDEAGIEASEDVLKTVRADLFAELYNPDVHLRARLQAGFTLGNIGDPRFEPKIINGIKVILPEMVGVPGGIYWIGSPADDPNAYDDEKPRHAVKLAAFSISRWSVTNAEFACFMAADGYENGAYWEGSLAQRWLQGEEVAGRQLSNWMQAWEFTQKNPDWKARLESTGSFTPDAIKSFEYIARLSKEDLQVELSRSLSAKSRRQPHYWVNTYYNNPSQPVVGVTWFEARAYCAWLSEVSGRIYRLPGEAEWEAAARGSSASNDKDTGENVTLNVYPWGKDFDPTKANTIEGRLLRPSPVGAYTAAGGVGPGGVEDQAGNVWEWTGSLYLPYLYQPEKAEDPESPSERVLRGGSWGDNRNGVRCACRDGSLPPTGYHHEIFMSISQDWYCHGQIAQNDN